MIQICEHKLFFSFPDIAAELDKLGESHVEQMLPVLVAEDRERALEVFLEENAFALETTGFREEARRVILGLSEEEIEHQLRVQAGLVKSRYSQTKGELSLYFERAFRIPNDDKKYSILPSFESFHLREVAAYAGRVPQQWVERGGALMPMCPSEALWLNFEGNYPFAIKIGAGKMNSVSGELGEETGLRRGPQNYVVTPSQRYLDGFARENEGFRQFTAMPLGAARMREDMFSSGPGVDALRFQVVPMKVGHYHETQRPCVPRRLADIVWRLIECRVPYNGPLINEGDTGCHVGRAEAGRVAVEIREDSFAADAWDLARSTHCFVQVCSSREWGEMTGEPLPYAPFTVEEYEAVRLPWLDSYGGETVVREK